MHLHCPASHTALTSQTPQLPPHPSAPHSFPSQVGWQTKTPSSEQRLSSGQSPQLSPHPSSPHSFPSQLPSHWQVPSTHSPFPEHSPHVPSQPSSPHSFPPQSGTQTGRHSPSLHSSPSSHCPHSPPQPSSPHTESPQTGIHPSTHEPSSQTNPLAQSPQVPPHPSEPHCAPAHVGMHPSAVWQRLFSLHVNPSAQPGHWHPLNSPHISWQVTRHSSAEGAFPSEPQPTTKSNETTIKGTKRERIGFLQRVFESHSRVNRHCKIAREKGEHEPLELGIDRG